jgi:Transposase DDE domain
MEMQQTNDSWLLFTENRDAVLDGLRQGKCDAILPAARTFLDGFASFLLKHKVIQHFAAFPDHRERVSIPAFLFCTILLHMPLFRMQRLATVENILFRSPYILRTLGFNARQIADGFYATSGARPFAVDAIGDFFADVPTGTLIAEQVALLREIRSGALGSLFAGATYSMDCMTVAAPPGKNGLPAARFQLCTLHLHVADCALPILWSYAPETGDGTGDVTQGQELVRQARRALRSGDIALLLVDRGFIDGTWLSEQADLETDVIIGLKTDMAAYADLLGLAQMPDSHWTTVEPPKNHRQPPPTRQVAMFDGIESWDSCPVPLTGLVVRDSYPDGTVEWQVYVSPRRYADGASFYADQRKRWDCEESYMALGRYWDLNTLPPMRLGLAQAVVHFTLLAYLLLGLFRWQERVAGRLTTPPGLIVPEVELAVYVGSHYALLTGSELVEIVLDHAEAWRSNRQLILTTLKQAERKRDSG